MTHALTPKAAAANAEIILSIVSDDRASREVWLGHDGALVTATRGSIVVESSTIPPDWARGLAAIADRRGLRFLDAPWEALRTRLPKVV